MVFLECVQLLKLWAQNANTQKSFSIFIFFFIRLYFAKLLIYDNQKCSNFFNIFFKQIVRNVAKCKGFRFDKKQNIFRRYIDWIRGNEIDLFHWNRNTNESKQNILCPQDMSFELPKDIVYRYMQQLTITDGPQISYKLRFILQ